MLDTLLYYFLYGLTYTLSLLPLGVLYVFSDFTYLIIYKLVGYRLKVVRKNLSSTFPEKSEKELRDIEHRFYHWFCDYIFETIKMASISEKEMRKRMRFENLDEIQKAVNEGKQVACYLAHYCNWEWISSFPHHIDNCIMGQIYHRLKSPAFNRLMLKIRGRFDATSIEMNESLAVIRKWQQEGQTNVIGYISDQAPIYESMHYWTPFLNHYTATYSGAERITRLFNGAAFYMDIKRVKRGYYVSTLHKICDNAKEEPIFAITEKYYRMLEKTIIDNPSCWLWTHNRWKRGWEEFCKRFPDEKDRQRMMSKL